MEERIKQIIADQLVLDVNQINLDTNLKTDLGLDSLDLFEIIMAVEDEYDIELPDDVVSKMTCIKDFINYIENKGKN